MGQQKHQEAMQGDDGVIESICRFGGPQPPLVGSQTLIQPMLSVEAVMDVVRAFFQPAEADDSDAARAHESRRRPRR
jgi:hypothetical protein